jgi:hypothetical protein
MIWRLALALISALALSSVFAPGVIAADATSAPRLSSQAARNIATSELRRRGEDVARFKAGVPAFQSQKKVWWVFFTQVAPPIMVDGDLLVVVDDASGSACVQQAIAVSPCV